MKANVHLAANLLVVSVAFAALASCGGGGGGGGGGGPGTPSATPVPLTAGNAQLATDEVLNASLSFVSVGGSNTGTGVVPLLAQPKVRPKTRLLVGVLRQQLGALTARSPLAATFVPAAPVTTPCDNGSGSVTVDAASTSTTVTFTSCSSGGETINGTLGITNIMSPSTGTVTGHVSHSLTFVQTGSPTVTSSGDFDINHTTAGNIVTDTLTGGPVTVQLDNDIAILSGFTLTSSVDTSTQALTDSFAGTIATGVLGGSVTVTTPTIFQTVGTSQFPNTGQLLITGAGNSAVRFTVLGDETLVGNQVTIEVDGNGDGTFDAPVEMTWAAL